MKRMLLVMITAALAASLGGSCARNDSVTAVDRDQFVTVVTELRQAAARTHGDPDGFEELKTAILTEHNVTEDDLRRYVEVHGADLEHMAEVWTAVNERLSDRSMDIR